LEVTVISKTTIDVLICGRTPIGLIIRTCQDGGVSTGEQR